MKKRMVFRFSARVVRDVEIPAGLEDTRDEYEKILDEEIQRIDVDRYAECDDVTDAREGEKLS